MATLIGEVTCANLNLYGLVMARLFDEVEVQGGECIVTDVYAIDMEDADPDRENSEIDAHDLVFSQTPDEDLIIEDESGNELSPEHCLWAFSFEINDYSLYKAIDDLLLYLFANGYLIGFVMDKHLEYETLIQN